MYNNNQDQIFQSMTEINAYKTEKLNILDIKITRYLMFQIREQGRKQTRLHGIPFIITAHELLGKSAFERIFSDERMPSLKQTIEIADKLNLFVEIRARRAGNNGIPHRLLAEGKLNRKAFATLIERLALSSEQRRCDVSVKKYRDEKLKLLRQNSSKVCWLTLIGYFAACGYDLDVWLTPKDLRSDHDKLIARLDYPV
jgi:hypothetical protein